MSLLHSCCRRGLAACRRSRHLQEDPTGVRAARHPKVGSRTPRTVIEEVFITHVVVSVGIAPEFVQLGVVPRFISDQEAAPCGVIAAWQMIILAPLLLLPCTSPALIAIGEKLVMSLCWTLLLLLMMHLLSGCEGATATLMLQQVRVHLIGVVRLWW